MNTTCQLNQLAVETVINNTASLDDVKPILARAAVLAEDMLLATGCIVPNESGSIWREVKHCYSLLTLPETYPVIAATRMACVSRLRRIAALADEDLAMDPRSVRFDHDE